MDYNNIPLRTAKGCIDCVPKKEKYVNGKIIDNFYLNPSIGGLGWVSRSDNWSVENTGYVDTPIPQYKDIKVFTSVNHQLGSYLPKQKQNRISDVKNEWFKTYLWQFYKEKVPNHNNITPTFY